MSKTTSPTSSHQKFYLFLWWIKKTFHNFLSMLRVKALTIDLTWIKTFLILIFSTCKIISLMTYPLIFLKILKILKILKFLQNKVKSPQKITSLLKILCQTKASQFPMTHYWFLLKIIKSMQNGNFKFGVKWVNQTYSSWGKTTKMIRFWSNLPCNLIQSMSIV
jgi:hypothetical protein